MDSEIIKNGRRYLKTKCEECGEYFYRRSDTKSKYCSQKCVGVQLKVDKSRICKHCGEVFEYRNKSEIYCSNKCRGKHTSLETIDVNCSHCGNILQRKPYEISNNNFCTMKCYHEYIKYNPIKGESHHRWNNGEYNHPHGYLSILQSDGTYKLEHRIVMEEYLGRQLSSDEIIHHIDGDKRNNNIDNLQIVTRAEHIAIHRELGDL